MLNKKVIVNLLSIVVNTCRRVARKAIDVFQVMSWQPSWVKLNRNPKGMQVICKPPEPPLYTHFFKFPLFTAKVQSKFLQLSSFRPLAKSTVYKITI